MDPNKSEAADTASSNTGTSIVEELTTAALYNRDPSIDGPPPPSPAGLAHRRLSIVVPSTAAGLSHRRMSIAVSKSELAGRRKRQADASVSGPPRTPETQCVPSACEDD